MQLEMNAGFWVPTAGSVRNAPLVRRTSAFPLVQGCQACLRMILLLFVSTRSAVLAGAALAAFCADAVVANEVGLAPSADSVPDIC